VPFLRFSRDKRGYEHTYLVQSTNRRGKAIRPRILYWYRTPPGVRLGRSPFDDDVRKTLEANNPGVVFDWATIVNTPFPPPDPAEIWRERRRIEKAARQARRDDEREPVSDAEAGEDEGETIPDLPESVALEIIDLIAEPVDTSAIELSPPVSTDGVPASEPSSAAEGAGGAPRKRRRRGGRRRRGKTPDGARPEGTAEAGAAGTPDPGTEPQNGESDPDD
jgi:hypothetical protein